MKKSQIQPKTRRSTGNWVIQDISHDTGTTASSELNSIRAVFGLRATAKVRKDKIEQELGRQRAEQHRKSLPEMQENRGKTITKALF